MLDMIFPCGEHLAHRDQIPFRAKTVQRSQRNPPCKKMGRSVRSCFSWPDVFIVQQHLDDSSTLTTAERSAKMSETMLPWEDLAEVFPDKDRSTVVGTLPVIDIK